MYNESQFFAVFTLSYQHKPGNVKAKEREERKRRQEAELQRISKIQKFFTPCAPNTDSLSLSTSTEHVSLELSESLLNTPDATTPQINNSDVSLSGVEESLNAKVELNHEKQPDRQTLVAMNCDIGLWPNGKLPDSFVEYWVERGSQDYIASILVQIFSSLFKMTANRRGGFPDLYFLVHSLNNEKIPRSWLCYSPATGRSFCFTCKLLSCSDNNVFARLGSSSSL